MLVCVHSSINILNNWALKEGKVSDVTYKHSCANRGLCTCPYELSDEDRIEFQGHGKPKISSGHTSFGS